MKILAVGCLHGKFPSKLAGRIKKEKIDFILCAGDLPDTTTIRDLEFRYWKTSLKTKNKSLDYFIGKKRYNKIVSDIGRSGLLMLRKLRSFNLPVVIVYGNSDFTNKEAKKYGLKGFESHCRRLGFKLLKNNLTSFNGIDILGFSGYRGAASKGFIDVDSTMKKKIKKYNFGFNERLKKAFERLKNPEKTIFMGHDVPFGYFDKITNKSSPLNGKHIGDDYILRYIKRYQPLLYVCAHMHEYQGLKEIGKTRVVTTGPAFEGRAALIEFDEGNKLRKVKKIKFYRK